MLWILLAVWAASAPSNAECQSKIQELLAPPCNVQAVLAGGTPDPEVLCASECLTSVPETSWWISGGSDDCMKAVIAASLFDVCPSPVPSAPSNAECQSKIQELLAPPCNLQTVLAGGTPDPEVLCASECLDSVPETSWWTSGGSVDCMKAAKAASLFDVCPRAVSDSGTSDPADSLPIPIGTCGMFDSKTNLYHVMDYAAKIAFERGFLKPPNTDFSIELYPVDTKCSVSYGAGASLPLLVGVGDKKGSFYSSDGKSQPPVVAISGCGCDTSTGGVASVSGSFQVPLVSGAATVGLLSRKDLFPFFSRSIPLDDREGLVLAKVIQNYGWDRVFTIIHEHPNDIYGLRVGETLALELNKVGVEYVSKQLPYTSNVAFDPTGIVAGIDAFLAAHSSQQRIFAILAMEDYVTMVVLRELDARGFVRPDTVFLLPRMSCSLATLNFTAKVAGFAATSAPSGYWNDGYDWGALFAKLSGVICIKPEAKGRRYASEEFKAFFTSLTVEDFAAAGMPEWMHNDPSWYADASRLDEREQYPYIFDAMSAIIYAVGTLKAQGVPNSQVRGPRLLRAIRKVKFEGLTGTVAMDVKGDRLGVYSVLNLQGPATIAGGGRRMGEVGKANLVKVGTYDLAQDTMALSAPVIFTGGGTSAPSSRPESCAAGEQPPQSGFGCELCPLGTANKVSGALACIPCDRGFYSAASGSQQCSMCPAGNEQPLEGETNCISCSPGSFAELPGQPKCAQCEPGFFSGTASTECTPCAIGTFATSAGSTGCETCPGTFTTKFRSTTLVAHCTCAKDTFWNRRADTCDLCQPDGECPGGFDPPTVYTDKYGVYVGTLSTEQTTNKEAGTYNRAHDAFTKLLIYNCRSNQCDLVRFQCILLYFRTFYCIFTLQT